jgi:putative Holliday junction resolvase
MGVDYGRRRIGLAISDPDRIVASVLEVIEVSNIASAVDRITAAVQETEASLVVVGVPYNMDGSSGEMAGASSSFARRLGAALSVPVELCDERLTTVAAERILLDADLSREKRKAVRDKVAARIILQDYLDSLPDPDHGDESVT